MADTEILTIMEQQEAENAKRAQAGKLKKFLVSEAIEELVKYITETDGLPDPLYDKALNLLNALNK